MIAIPKLTRLLAAICVSGALTGLSNAQTRTEAILDAFEGWQAEHAISRASIAVITRGGTMVQKSYGQRSDRSVPLASLSKAITGACIAALQQQGVFDLGADVADLLDLPGARGSLGAFLSHRSGLTPDRTQGQPWHLHPSRTPRHSEAATWAFAAPRGADDFSYNNENYAVLGAVIDSTAQEGYEATCRRFVFEPLGITTAHLDPVWGPHGAWGGWAMSVADYARFIKEWFGSGRNIDPEPLTWPHSKLGHGVAYVMGAFHRRHQGAQLFWHAGLLCWEGEGDGSYFASYGGDPVVVVSFSGCIEDAGFARLDGVLFEAARP